MAEKIGCTQSKVSKIESAYNAELSVQDLLDYGKVMNLELELGYRHRSVKIVDMIKYHAFKIKNLFDQLTDLASLVSMDLTGSYVTLDSGFDSEINRQLIRSHNMVPVIRPNRRGTKDEEKLEKMFNDFNELIYKKRFAIERTFAWQDTYRKLAHSYERPEATRNGLKYLAYSLVNLRVMFGGNSL